MADSKSDSPEPVIIKKYANRRLYNTRTSSYVTLDHLCELVKAGTEFEVKDARTGEDITRSVLTQIIFEEEAKGQNLLPIKFLRQLIGFYGDSLQAFVPGYLDMSMENFSRQQAETRQRIAQAFGAGPQAIEAMTRQNLALFEKTMRMFSPFPVAPREPEPQPRSAGNGAGEQRPTSGKAASADEVNELKSEIETMRRQLAELAKARGERGS